MKGKWFGRGYDEADKAASSSAVFKRFFLKPGEERQIVFLDEEPFVFWEHNVMIDGDWRNFVTCLAGMEQCPCCERGISRYFIGAYSIIDMTGWTDRDGKQHKNEKRLLLAKRDNIKRLKRAKDRYSGLTKAVFSVYRTSPKAFVIGDDWNFIRKMEDIKAELGIDPTPYDYEEEFQPKTREAIIALNPQPNIYSGKGGGRRPPADDSEPQGGGFEQPEPEEDIPF